MVLETQLAIQEYQALGFQPTNLRAMTGRILEDGDLALCVNSALPGNRSVTGLDNAPPALTHLFRGDNMGKLMVEIEEGPVVG